MLTSLLMLACLLGAAAVGFAAHRGGTCGVVAVRRYQRHRDPSLLIGFVAATGAATLVCLPLAWGLGRGADLPGSAPIGLALLGGAVLLGIGAVVNGVCLIGSLWRMGNGEVHLIGLPLGIAVGDLLGGAMGLRTVLPPSRFAQPDGAGLMLVAAGGVLLAAAAAWLRRSGPGGSALLAVMVTMGFAGSLLFVVMPGWTWVDLVNTQAHNWEDAMMRPLAPGGRVVLATLGGALASGWMTGKLRLKWRGWAAVARSAVGGLLMMLGIGLIPGGNDGLLLGAAPAGSISALLAFAIMNLSIMALLMMAPVTPAAAPGPR